MKSVFRIILFIYASVCLFGISGCVVESGIGDAGSGCEREVIFDLVTDAFQTRSSMNATDSQIKRVNIVVYDNKGILAAETSGTSLLGLKLSLNPDKYYTAYVLANVYVPFVPVSESEFISQVYEVDYSEMFNVGLPMYGKSQLNSSQIIAGRALVILERLASRIGVQIDKSNLVESSLSIKSVRIRQAAKVVSPFSGPFVADEQSVTDGDAASAFDIENLNGGSGAVLYTLENVQGELLPDVTDPSDKNFENIPAHALRCTYLEIIAAHEGNIDGVPVESDNVVYRFYLGKNTTSDFSLTRNMSMVITLVLSDDGMYKHTWKVDYGVSLPEITYQMRVTPESAVIEPNTTVSFKAMLSKYVNGSLFSTEDVTSLATWTSSKPSLASVANGMVTGHLGGHLEVKASYKGVYNSAYIEVEDLVEYKILSMRINCNTSKIEVGQSTMLSLILEREVYVNKVYQRTEEAIYSPAVASWSIVSGSSYATLNSLTGLLKGVSPGNVTVQAMLKSDSSIRASYDIEVYSDDLGTDTGWEGGGDVDLN